MSRPARFLALLLIALPLTYLTPFAKDKDPQLPPSPAAKVTTVGEFALRVLRLAEDDPAKKAGLTAEEAIARLEKAGLHLGKPDDPLTDKHKSDFALAVSQGLLEKVSPPPVGFEVCGALPKVPDCHACCLALPGASNQACGRSCGRAHADQQHASPSEPTP